MGEEGAEVEGNVNTEDLKNLMDVTLNLRSTLSGRSVSQTCLFFGMWLSFDEET